MLIHVAVMFEIFESPEFQIEAKCQCHNEIDVGDTYSPAQAIITLHLLPNKNNTFPFVKYLTRNSCIRRLPCSNTSKNSFASSVKYFLTAE